MLTLVPVGGLCNRLRSLFSALQVASAVTGGVTVEWSKDSECKAYFDELFLPIDSQYLRVVSRHWWARPARLRNLLWPALLRTLMGYRVQCEGYRPIQVGDFERIATSGHLTYISTGYELCPYPADSLSLLVPRPELKQRIARMTARFVTFTVGVHIRRTDNSVSISQSPVAAFRKAMDEEVRRDPCVRFFLATDDETLKAQLQRDYAERIITRPTHVRRDTFEGMQEAVVDLFCLASTKKILGSYWSSFSDTAAELGHVPITVVRG